MRPPRRNSQPHCPGAVPDSHSGQPGRPPSRRSAVSVLLGRAGGMPSPKSPWGKKTLGKRTRFNKRTDKYIVRRRVSKKR